MKTSRTNHLPRIISLLVIVLVLLGSKVFAQNLKDDIVNNDLEGLKSKVALLEPDFKAFPYIAHYLRNAREYQQVMIDYLISKGASPDQVDDRGVGPLYYAIASDNLEAVATLIAAKANVNSEWTKPKDAFWDYDFSINKDDVNELPLFDAKKIEFVYDGMGKFTLRPLAVALYSRNTDIVPALLKAGADPLGWLYHIKDVKLSTPTKAVYSYSNTIFDHVVGRFAVSGGDLGVVDPTFFANAVTVWKAVMALPAAKRPAVDPKLSANLFAYFASGAMKEFKAELVKTGSNTLAFLPYAALAGNWDIVDLIYKYNGLELDDPFDNNNQSLLAWCISNLHAGAANLLIEHGATIPDVVKILYKEYYSEKEYVPLVWATLNNKPELVKVLLAYKADPNKGFPIFYSHASPAVRKLLLDAGADSNATITYSDKKYMHLTLVQDAAWDDKPEAVAFWLEQGLDPNGTGSGQPLVAAVVKGNPESVRILLAKGAGPGVIIDSEHRDFYRIPEDFMYKPLIEYARYRVTQLDDPLAKSRAGQVVKLLEKAQAAKGGEYAIGATGPGGGLVFFDKGYVSDGWRYLEAAPSDQSGLPWYNGEHINIETGKGIGSGKANTAAIVAAQGPGSYAASLCANLSGSGYSDWFLPSTDELYLMYQNLQKAGKGRFGGGSYWSSSGNSTYSAWSQHFSDGSQEINGKSEKLAVRAVRAF